MGKQNSRIKEYLQEMKKKKRQDQKDRGPSPEDKMRALQQDPKGKQMIEESPIYEVKDGKHRLVKRGYRPKRSFGLGKNPLAKKKKKKEN